MSNFQFLRSEFKTLFEPAKGAEPHHSACTLKHAACHDSSHKA